MMNRSKKAICVVLAGLCCLSLMSCKKTATKSDSSKDTATVETDSSTPTKSLSACRLTYNAYAEALAKQIPELKGYAWANKTDAFTKTYTKDGDPASMGTYYEIAQEPNGHYILKMGSMTITYNVVPAGNYQLVIALSDSASDQKVKEVWRYALAVLGDYSPTLDAKTFLKEYDENAEAGATFGGPSYKIYETTVGDVTYSLSRSASGMVLQLSFDA